MTRSEVRHVAVARRSPRVAIGLFEFSVQIWDFETGRVASRFETVLDFGGNRLALSADGSTCVAAAWRGGQQGGVCCYDTETGSVVWHRPDLSETQDVSFSSQDDGVWYMPDTASALRLDVRTGRTTETLKGIQHVVEDPRSRLRLFQRHRSGYVLDGPTRVLLPQISFGLLSAAVAPEAVCISEAASVVRCFGADGAERWRFDPGAGAHVLSLWYGRARQHFYAVRYDYRNGGHRLLSLDQRDGSHDDLADLGDCVADASPEQDRLIATDGSMYRLSSGELVAQLDFPATGARDR